MAIPDQPNFSLSAVLTEVGLGSANGLAAAFTASIDSYFDDAYKGSKDRLSNFRNYGPKDPFPISDSPFAAQLYQEVFYAEDGGGAFAAAVGSGLTWINGGASSPMPAQPTAANPNTSVARCTDTGMPSGSAARGTFIEGGQTKGAIVFEVVVDILVYGAADSTGIASALCILNRADVNDSWSGVVGMNGYQWNGAVNGASGTKSSWAGYGGYKTPTTGGPTVSGWRAQGASDLTANGVGGAGTLQCANKNNLNSGASATFLFAYDEPGDYTFQMDPLNVDVVQCTTAYIDKINYSVSLNCYSLYDGNNTLYDYYVSSTATSSTSATTPSKYYKAYEPYGKFVQQFYEYDAGGNLVEATSLSGTNYWKKLNGLTSPIVIQNLEETSYGQYTGNLTAGSPDSILGYSTLT